jgi:hypothetical protein
VNAVTINLTKGAVTVVDLDDHAELSKYKWQIDSAGYASRNTKKPDGKRTRIRMHHHLLGPGRIDHKNTDKLDNRRENLRKSTVQENNRNVNKRGGSSRFKGVSWKKGRHNCWKACIKIDSKQRHLGYYHDEIEAARAYDAAARENFGEFALLNFKES